ncbi:MAG: hypothetical protein IKY73_02740 [Bacteroidaceae bacterium]|nr:hypothetical protein [Bacteroidaceae bacterium]
MKKYIKLYALLVAALFVAACDDDFEQGYEPVKIVSGEDIPFGVAARVSNGGKTTRTVYGAVVDDIIEVNWVIGDKLTISSPQAGGAKDGKATYEVADVAMNMIQGANSKATTLEKIGDAGLQWTDAEEYTFYAMYPSIESFSENERANVDIHPDGDDEYAYPHMTGWLPVTQTPAGEIKADANGVYTIAPDMRYAFMTAKTTYNTKNEFGEANENPVYLEFNSLTTAVQFELTAADLLVNGTYSTNIEIQSVTLSSKSGSQICGGFVYNYNNGTIKPDEAANSNLDLSSITMDLVSKNISLTTSENGTYTEEGTVNTNYKKYDGKGKLNLTFFLLPTYSQEEDESDLQLKVIYKVGGIMQGKTATVNAEIKPSWKHYFGGLKLPAIKLGKGEEASASNWFSLLNDKIYISQLSFAVAGNAFSNNSAAAYKEQVHDYETLWDMGVRGFEICTYNIDNNSSSSIGTGPIVSGGEAVSGYTVSSVFENLYSKLGDETLVLIFTARHTSGYGTFNPKVFVDQITNYLNAFLVKVNGDKTDETQWTKKREDLFVRLGSKSCVGDLKGKIAIIVRPGDNDYVKALNVDAAEVSEDWVNYITVIDDWGTGEDQWGDRYGNYYDAENYSAAGGKSVFENQYLLYKAGTRRALWGSWSYSEGGAFPEGVEAKDKNYGRKVNNDESDIAYVQCWERVVQADDNEYRQAHYDEGGITSGSSLEIKWFESYSEKKKMAEYILGETMKKKGEAHSPLYINSLCGFFISGSIKMSYQPLLSGSANFGGKTIKIDKSGTGGDFKSCAANLNYWMYNKLKDNTVQGPYGIIMLDYIGATESDFTGIAVSKEDGLTAAAAAEASINLPALIMMNNFKFPLAMDPDYGNDNTMEKVELSQQPLDQGKDFLRWIEE